MIPYRQPYPCDPDPFDDGWYRGFLVGWLAGLLMGGVGLITSLYAVFHFLLS